MKDGPPHEYDPQTVSIIHARRRVLKVDVDAMVGAILAAQFQSFMPDGGY